jgi:hypothetical protein
MLKTGILANIKRSKRFSKSQIREELTTLTSVRNFDALRDNY